MMNTFMLLYFVVLWIYYEVINVMEVSIKFRRYKQPKNWVGLIKCNLFREYQDKKLYEFFLL